jgi:4-hydroxy-tetrahydrodipicolinate synthase
MIQGSLVALATPFTDADEVDYEALARLIDFHCEAGTDGLVIAGTTGESATLLKEEHAALVRRAVELADGRIRILAGTGSNSTRQTLALSQAVDGAGIDGFLMVAPYYNKPTQEGMYRHFTTVADAVSKPVMLYNVPGRTASDLLPETVARLAAHERIFGIKDATGDVRRLEAMQAVCPANFRYFSGDDFTSAAFLLAGGHGVVSVTANVVPALMAQMCRAAAAGDASKVRDIDAGLQPVNKALFLESNPIPVKWALHRMGLMGQGIRLPLTPLDPRFRADVDAALAGAGIVLSTENPA